MSICGELRLLRSGDVVLMFVGTYGKEGTLLLLPTTLIDL